MKIQSLRVFLFFYLPLFYGLLQFMRIVFMLMKQPQPTL
jgi:hypothetical protein